MNRRRFIWGLVRVAPAALIVPELLAPKRTIFLSPTEGWAAAADRSNWLIDAYIRSIARAVADTFGIPYELITAPCEATYVSVARGYLERRFPDSLEQLSCNAPWFLLDQSRQAARERSI